MKSISSLLLVSFLLTNATAQLKIDNATFFIQPGATVTVQGDVQQCGYTRHRFIAFKG